MEWTFGPLILSPWHVAVLLAVWHLFPRWRFADTPKRPDLSVGSRSDEFDGRRHAGMRATLTDAESSE